MSTLTQSQLDAATNGTLNLAAGTYSLTQTLNVHSGTTIIGDPAGGTKLIFNLPAPAYGFELDAGASNVTIKQIDFTSNHGVISMRSGGVYNNITITMNRFAWGGGQINGVDVQGIICTSAGSGNKVTYNYFHDSQQTDRPIEWYGGSNQSFDYNTFSNISNGGQYQSLGANNSISYGYYTELANKMIEAGISDAVNLTVTGNVGHSWVSTSSNSMGISVLMTSVAPATGWPVNITHNFVDLSLAGRFAGGVSGVVMEMGGGPLNCSNNICGGASAPGIYQTDTQGSTGSGNQAYGPVSWAGVVGTEGGDDGQGTWLEASSEISSYDPILAHMPQPPSNTNAYLGSTTVSTGTTTGTPTNTGGSTVTTPAIAGLTGTSTVSGIVSLTWTTPLPAAGTLSIISTVGRQAFQSITLAAGATSATIENVHPGWQLDFQITSGTETSAVATVTVIGNSAAAYSGNPSLVSATTPPPVAPAVDPIVSVTVTRQSGKTTTLTP